MTLYLALEGPDGGGKTTQADWLCARLGAAGHDTARLREPGSTQLGEGLRELLLAKSTGEVTTAAEALLFFAARAEMIAHQVAPALARGAVVVAERCYLSSSVVYQGAAREADGLIPAQFDSLVEIACGAVVPDRIFVLDVSADVGAQRRSASEDDRIEARGRAYLDRVRRGYLDAAERDPRVVVVDATASADAVHERLWTEVMALLEASQ